MTKDMDQSMKIVSDILEKRPGARDDDKLLYALYLYNFTDIGDLHNASRLVAAICHEDTLAPETITRARRKLQEKGLFWGKRKEKREHRAKDISLWSQNN